MAKNYINGALVHDSASDEPESLVPTPVVEKHCLAYCGSACDCQLREAPISNASGSNATMADLFDSPPLNYSAATIRSPRWTTTDMSSPVLATVTAADFFGGVHVIYDEDIDADEDVPDGFTIAELEG